MIVAVDATVVGAVERFERVVVNGKKDEVFPDVQAAAVKIVIKIMDNARNFSVFFCFKNRLSLLF